MARHVQCAFVDSLLRIVGAMLIRFGLAALLAMAAAGSAQAKRLYVDGPYGQIHVRTEGPQDGPKLVLLHKMFWSSVQFERAQGLLAKRGIFSIAIDLPGYGFSDAPSAEPGAADYAAILVPVLDALKVKRAVVLGVDTGSSIALAFADAHPDRVSRLIFDGSPIFDTATARKLIEAPHFDRTPLPGGAHLQRRWDAVRAIVGADQASDANVQTSVLQFFTAAPNWWWAHDAIFKYDFASVLARVKPTGMLLSFPGGALHPQEDIFMKIRPDYRLHPISVGAFTTPSYDAPEAWASAVADDVLENEK
ncbi:alpha/beta hydrolase fold [Sphingomonas sp. YR710]|uniref:alpha/beta fold hydrolase n=1 Tax=Sphingomonas sp. YR710 TaxID=1882773 RepID=UPI00088DCD91|nr:alpha/beta fold hydrolase [Sphingomonas sp. YR710]SDC82948.1 alpha/beta hydrolase fold [Sphingomonas sp. YR710]